MKETSHLEHLGPHRQSAPPHGTSLCFYIPTPLNTLNMELGEGGDPWNSIYGSISFVRGRLDNWNWGSPDLPPPYGRGMFLLMPEKAQGPCERADIAMPGNVAGSLQAACPIKPRVLHSKPLDCKILLGILFVVI